MHTQIHNRAQYHTNTHTLTHILIQTHTQTLVQLHTCAELTYLSTHTARDTNTHSANQDASTVPSVPGLTDTRADGCSVAVQPITPSLPLPHADPHTHTQPPHTHTHT